ncbi:MAG: protein kinase domain-containing protein, partial [Nannocystaceae bacterium]
CSALEYAHSAGIVHRDIKPSNCLLTAFASNPALARVKLIDFGIARDPHIRSGFNTGSGLYFGTPEYMAPERGGSQPAAISSDIYSVGVMLYKLVTGSLPFSGGDAVDVLNRHRHEPVVPPNERVAGLSLPPAAEKVIMTALAKRPSERFCTAGKMASAIDLSLWQPLEDRVTLLALNTEAIAQQARSTLIRAEQGRGRRTVSSFGRKPSDKRAGKAMPTSSSIQVNADTVFRREPHAQQEPVTTSGAVEVVVDATPGAQPSVLGGAFATQALGDAAEVPQAPFEYGTQRRGASIVRWAFVVGLGVMFQLISGWIAEPGTGALYAPTSD